LVARHGDPTFNIIQGHASLNTKKEEAPAENEAPAEEEKKEEEETPVEDEEEAADFDEEE
jgi:hypothetical protein